MYRVATKSEAGSGNGTPPWRLMVCRMWLDQARSIRGRGVIGESRRKAAWVRRARGYFYRWMAVDSRRGSARARLCRRQRPQALLRCCSCHKPTAVPSPACFERASSCLQLACMASTILAYPDVFGAPPTTCLPRHWLSFLGSQCTHHVLLCSCAVAHHFKPASEPFFRVSLEPFCSDITIAVFAIAQ